MGKRSGLVIGVRYCTTKCVKCDKNIAHDKCFCPRNHSGSSGSMESLGAVFLVTDLLETHNCLIEKLLIDDDASTKDALQASKWRDKKGVRGESMKGGSYHLITPQSSS